MAIVTEYYKTRSDGVDLVRTYSDAGFLIEREGIQYSEAVDPAGLGREYIEGDTRGEVSAEEALAELTEVLT